MVHSMVGDTVGYHSCGMFCCHVGFSTSAAVGHVKRMTRQLPLLLNTFCPNFAKYRRTYCMLQGLGDTSSRRSSIIITLHSQLCATRLVMISIACSWHLRRILNTHNAVPYNIHTTCLWAQLTVLSQQILQPHYHSSCHTTSYSVAGLHNPPPPGIVEHKLPPQHPCTSIRLDG